MSMIQKVMCISLVCFMAFLVLLSTLVALRVENKWEVQEPLLAYLIDSGVINQEMAELMWINCRLELIHAKEALQNLEVCAFEEWSTNKEIYNARSSPGSDIRKTIDVLHPEVKQILTDCLRERNLMFSISREEKVTRRGLIQRLGAPAPAVSSSSDSFARATNLKLSDLQAESAEHDAREDNHQKTIVIAVVITAVVTFLFSAILFICCRWFYATGFGWGRNDESPLISLSLSDYSIASSQKSSGIRTSVNEEKLLLDNRSSDSKISGTFYMKSQSMSDSKIEIPVETISTATISSADESVEIPPRNLGTSGLPLGTTDTTESPPGKTAPPPPPPPAHVPPAPPVKPPPNIPCAVAAGPPPPPPPPTTCPPPPPPASIAPRPPPPVSIAPPPPPLASIAPPSPPPASHAPSPPPPAHSAPPPPPVTRAPPPPPPVTRAPPPPPPVTHTPPPSPPSTHAPPPPPLATCPPPPPITRAPPPPPPAIPSGNKASPCPPPPAPPSVPSGIRTHPHPPPPPGGVSPPRPPAIGLKAPPPPPLGSSSWRETGAPKAKLKPFFWDKVLANSNHSMVWHQIRSGSFQFNEEMIETLFGYNPAEKKKSETKKESSSQDRSSQFVQIIDSKKSQNLSILLKALNVTTEEVCFALQEGTELPVEFIRTLIKMAPTGEEQEKLRLYSGDLSRLGTAERFLKVLVDIPFVFKRLESLLFMCTLQEEATMIKDAFRVLEAACDELRKSRLFLKLLEAVLKTGNRMNDGTFRGRAQAFKLDTLLKLSDVKGTDGKTTLLHFVVQEIIRSEGVRASRAAKESKSSSSIKSDDLVDESSQDSDEHFCTIGLQVVSGLGGELENVKKAAVLDADDLTGTVAKLNQDLKESRDFLNNEMKIVGEDEAFHQTLKSFVLKAEVEIKWLIGEEKRIMALVKNTADYFHGKSGKDEGLQLFVVVRDFLVILDKACEEVKNSFKPSRVLKKEDSTNTTNIPSTPPPTSPDPRRRLFPARRVDSSSSDDDL